MNTSAMNWYLVHTKPRQEGIALDNLMRQDYECYMPTLPVEKIRKSALTLVEQPLFPRYLFIRLGQGLHESAYRAQPQKLFEVGQKVVITQGPFAGIEGIFQMSDGEQRVMVLIEIMSKQVPLRVAPHEVKSAV